MKYLNIEKLKSATKKNNDCGRRARRKLEVITRDGFKCVNCSAKEELTIAHKTPPKRNKNRNSSSYNPDDCKTLCVRCHKYEETTKQKKEGDKNVLG